MLSSWCLKTHVSTGSGKNRPSGGKNSCGNGTFPPLPSAPHFFVRGLHQEHDRAFPSRKKHFPAPEQAFSYFRAFPLPGGLFRHALFPAKAPAQRPPRARPLLSDGNVPGKHAPATCPAPCPAGTIVLRRQSTSYYPRSFRTTATEGRFYEQTHHHP